MSYWTIFLQHVDNPKLLWIIPVLIIIAIFFITRDFVKLAEDNVTKRARRRQQWVMIFTRSLIIAALVLALASPFVERTKTVSADPFLKILVDSSDSMKVYPDVAENLRAQLQQTINAETHNIASGASSPIGDGILNNVKEGDNVILVTDGRANIGANLGDVALFGAGHNITFNALDFSPENDDAFVMISGPEKTVSKVDNTYTVITGWAGAPKNLHVTVIVDGKVVLDETDNSKMHTFTEQFSEGYHTIEARIEVSDFNADNNVFYKTVKVVPKPKVLLWSQIGGTPFETFLRQVFDVTLSTDLPVDLEPFYSVVTNDLPGGAISDDDSSRLQEYLEDGNGMYVVGGKGSYNNGGYRNTYFETLLPVVVGTPGREPGDVNIVILIDASQSVGSEQGGGVEVAKGLAKNVLDQMSPNVKVAITAFRNAAFTVAPLGYKYEHPDLEDKISQIYGYYSSKMHLGIQRSTEILKGAQGSKNIIIVSDGLLFANDQQAAKDAALLARKHGIKVYTVGAGVGSDEYLADRIDEDMMKELASLTNGIYFRARDASKLNLLFGDVKTPDDEEEKKDWGVAVLDSNHFITEDITVNGSIYGFNEVAPKTTGRMLVTTDSGEPLITTWHVGLGRVVAYTTDEGNAWAGELLTAENSKVLVRAMNWVNGDPDRKRNDLVDIKDTRVNVPTDLTIKATNQPTAEGLAFFKIRPDTYQAEVTPTSIGFHNILGATYAANYPEELAPLGPSRELDLLVGSTGGKYFSPDEADKMVEFAQTHAVKTITAKDYFRWHLSLFAAGLFLTEILLRRLLRR